jgi:hypothetical protein
MKVLLGFLLLLVAHRSFTQGVVVFGNGSSQPVLNFCTGAPIVAGDTFLAGLYFAQDGITDESQFVKLGAAAEFWQPGVFSGGGRTAPTAIRGGYGMFQVRVWETAFGSTYEDAAGAPAQNGRSALLGKSNIFRADTADPEHPTKPPMTILHQGFRGFYVGDAITCIPEPNIIFFWLLAMAGIVSRGTAKFVLRPC